MATETLKCPNCGTEIQLSEALQNQIREDLRNELEEELSTQQENLRKRLSDLTEKEKALKERSDVFEEELENGKNHGTAV